MVKVGLVTGAVTPSARAAPRTNVVFPAPNSPSTSTTSPETRRWTSAAPTPSVSSGPVVWCRLEWPTATIFGTARARNDRFADREASGSVGGGASSLQAPNNPAAQLGHVQGRRPGRGDDRQQRDRARFDDRVRAPALGLRLPGRAGQLLPDSVGGRAGHAGGDGTGGRAGPSGRGTR